MNENEILSLGTDILRPLYHKIEIELEKRDMNRTRLIDSSINMIFRDGFRNHVPDKVIYIIRNNISCHWEEIFKILRGYNINNMTCDGYKIILKFTSDNKFKLYYDILDIKEEIIETIEKLF
jgi:hypothetical protein